MPGLLPPSTPLPNDFGYLLGQIDAKLDSLVLRLDSIVSRSDVLDQRVQLLEAANAQRQQLLPVFTDMQRRVDDLEKSRDSIAGGAKATVTLLNAFYLMIAMVVGGLAGHFGLHP